MTWKTAAVIEPHAARYRALCQGLKKAGLTVTSARDVDELSREHVVVIGSSVAGAARVAGKVRAKHPRAFVMAAQNKGFRAAWADAVLPLPVSPNDLRLRLAELASAEPAALPVANPGDEMLDAMTSFYTFAQFKEVLLVEVKRARRYGFPLALALVGFDPVDLPGDGALRRQLMSGLALAIRRSLRDTDYPVQQAPDRVLILMPHTDLAGSLIVARRICDRVANATLQCGEQVVHPTISVGVAAGDPSREYAFADLVRQAKEGLSAAIAKGGNRVECISAVDAPTRPMELRVPPVPPTLATK